MEINELAANQTIYAFYTGVIQFMVNRADS